jgi:hypothetical protein
MPRHGHQIASGQNCTGHTHREHETTIGPTNGMKLMSRHRPIRNPKFSPTSDSDTA